MSLPVFNPPVPPDSPMKKKRSTRLYSFSQGDGYTQEVGAGLNARFDTLPVSWSDLSVEEIDDIEGQLESVPKGGCFLWTAPRQAAAQKWKCPTWERTYKAGLLDGLSATFTEVFDLDD